MKNTQAGLVLAALVILVCSAVEDGDVDEEPPPGSGRGHGPSR